MYLSTLRSYVEAIWRTTGTDRKAPDPSNLHPPSSWRHGCRRCAPCTPSGTAAQARLTDTTGINGGADTDTRRRRIQHPEAQIRTEREEARRAGKECVSTGKSRWLPYQKKNTTNIRQHKQYKK